MDSPRLRILILGSPIVTWDDVALKIDRQQIRLLLYYLAAQVQPINRDTICQIFWQSEDDEKAHKLFRESLSKLRALLPDPSVLVAHAGEVFFGPAKSLCGCPRIQTTYRPFSVER